MLERVRTAGQSSLQPDLQLVKRMQTWQDLQDWLAVGRGMLVQVQSWGQLLLQVVVWTTGKVGKVAKVMTEVAARS